MRYLTILAVLLGLTALFNSISPFHKTVVHKTIVYGLSPKEAATAFIRDNLRINENPAEWVHCKTVPVSVDHVDAVCMVKDSYGNVNKETVQMFRSTWQLVPGSTS